jgi:predicted phosphoadenosine phosphosulfate sulfurtransferase
MYNNLNYILNWFTYRGCFEWQEAIDVGAREGAVMLEPDTNAWKRLCISFLKSGIWK